MEVSKILHMNSGVGDKSYAKNSLLQQKATSIAWPVIKKAIEGLCSENNNPMTTLSIADLGCSSGPNTLTIVSNLIKQFQLHNNKPIQYQIFFNDLPSNDFNSIFISLQNFLEDLKNQIGADFGTCFFNGVPGSFYGRLFPDKSLHFVHSCYSLQWLSQVPREMEIINKGSIFIDNKSPKNVIEGYYKQFQKDFSLFLKCREEEVVSGGRMVVTLVGRTDEYPSNQDYCYAFTLLNLALNDMVAEGIVEEEKVDRFNIPNFMPSPKEIKDEVLKEGSFIINELKVSSIDWNFYNTEMEGTKYTSFIGTSRNGDNKQREYIHRQYESKECDQRGLIKEEKVDQFNIPKFRPSPEEVKVEILKEGSFMINCVQVSRIDWNFYNNGEFDGLLSNNNVCGEVDSSYYFAKCIRSVYEPLLIFYFEEAIVDELFQRYSKIIKDEMSNNKYEYINLTVSLTKI
ncbi:salicylate carboxymethyltransferase-like [Cucumis melo]|uniref:Salicylate carboxymethyltransferase-like n=1 Tax=Cucumis melo TaxID=3656 RepID=A0A1S3B2L4_CUCME|nr:salicylate carboxymethyltransferase-like [Cucumis melo]